MRTVDLDYSFPEDLIATEPSRPTRVMLVDGDPFEFTLDETLERIPAGDVLVLNDTRVLRRRVFAGETEILFLSSEDGRRWQVLFPSRALKIGDRVDLPGGRFFTLTKKGRPQEVETDAVLDEEYFARNGELPLPPYIQKARDHRHAVGQDEKWYQTAWADKPGSFAAPTASLHFTTQDLEKLKARGVKIVTLTLHVGLGTFLPVVADDLDQHEMHSEWAEISSAGWRDIEATKTAGGKVWALGTTVARTLESVGAGKLERTSDGGYRGFTDLLIQPGYTWTVVDRLMTNFHQPKSTLLALVAAFAGLDKTKACYQWAISRRFRLFSYGDFSVWMR